MSDLTTIFWFRRDLRLKDNHGLYQALTKHNRVMLLFIFDRDILDHLEDKEDARVEFLHRKLRKLKQQVDDLGSSVYVATGTPKEVFETLLLDYKVEAVYANHDYEPYAIKRDQEIAKLLRAHGSELHTFKDQVIFEKNEVVKDDGKPYTVFTPYMRKWKDRLKLHLITKFPSEDHLGKLIKTAPFVFPTLQALGFQSTDKTFPSPEPDATLIENYHLTRDIPGIVGTTRLSVHLRFGTISIREITNQAIELNEKWLNELIWRNFYMMILWHFPKVVTEAFKPKYDLIAWRNHPKEFEAWCQGQTGYPIVDAGMRELNETGFMHNRVRMITASFLTKHLLIDWRWGEAYFASKLLDHELASNNGGWQWAASSGCDAVPYFRIFNPELQTKRFDPELKYIKKWVPEFQEFDYPQPIVDHKAARERALAAYRSALAK